MVSPAEKPTQSDTISVQPPVDIEAITDSHTDLEDDVSDTDGAEEPQLELARTQTGQTGHSLRRVPTLQRRGYGQLTLIAEVENPRSYSYTTKWTLTVIVALAAVAGPMGSSIIYPSLADMADGLHTSKTVGNVTVAIYMLGMAIFPLWWSSLSEVLGRRLMYLCSFSLFVLFGALSASAQSIGGLIAVRFFAGGASASVQTVGAGTIADIWAPEERGKAMGIFYMGPLLGPMIAPLLGGAIAQSKGWRWSLWLLTMYGGAVLGMIFFILPETSKRKTPGPPSSSLSKSAKVRAGVKRYFIDPVKVLGLMRSRVIYVAVLYAAITFGAVYIINISLTLIFESAPYNFSEIEVGLMYTPMSTGYMFTSFLSGGWSDNIMKKAQQKAKRFDHRGMPIYYPEDRFGLNMWVGLLLYPVSLVVYGWVTYYEQPWWSSIFPLFTFGIGTMIIFGVATASLTEFVPKRSSAGVAVNNFIRNIFSFIGSLLARPALEAGGAGKVFSIVAGICLVSGVIGISLINKFGAEWRERLDASEGYERRKPVALEEHDNESDGTVEGTRTPAEK